MQIVNAQTSTPTHVAFFNFAPQDRVHFVADEYASAVESLMRRYPNKGIPTIQELTLAAAQPAVDMAAVVATVVREGCSAEAEGQSRTLSTWTSQVVDHEAKARIDAQQAKLAALGVSGFGGERYETGTRMAAEGYATQAQRAAEHERKMPLREAADALIERVRSERRTDVVVTARELASQVTVNGALKIGGLRLQEQAIRGLLMRAESPATGYVFGLRDRIAAKILESKSLDLDFEVDREKKKSLLAMVAADKAELAQVLAHELMVAGDLQMKLRTRAGADVFAAVSPKYAAADAPEVLAEVLKGLPEDARGSWSYDPVTTSWELRAEVWTPTPAAEQAVGEPFRGYVSFRSKDNGTGSLNGGGGIEIIACLNASTYVADSSEVNRRHVGRIVADVEAMVAKARIAIDALCEAWGVARRTELSPAYEAQVGLTLSQAIPGFWWGEFGDRKSELHHVLRGSSKQHVEALTLATLDERVARGREEEPLVKADLAQGWTKYIQRLPSDVRRDAEAAAASWVVSGRPVRFDADRVAP